MKYTYYLRQFGELYRELYRMPSDYKNDEVANIRQLNQYQGQGVWLYNDATTRTLLDDYSTGYFSFQDDEILTESRLNQSLHRLILVKNSLSS